MSDDPRTDYYRMCQDQMTMESERACRFYDDEEWDWDGLAFEDEGQLDDGDQYED